MTLLQHLSMNANATNKSKSLFASFAYTRKTTQMRKPIRIKGQNDIKLRITK